MTKKRHAFGSKHPATYTPGWCAGETSGRAKLTEQKVKDIRRIFSEGGISKAELGRQYGVTDVAISKVISRENWKCV
jgi:DNA invertase Pin-like site-specific DNA recombinase